MVVSDLEKIVAMSSFTKSKMISERVFGAFSLVQLLCLKTSVKENDYMYSEVLREIRFLLNLRLSMYICMYCLGIRGKCLQVSIFAICLQI
jgi:hypothetical protein